MAQVRDAAVRVTLNDEDALGGHEFHSTHAFRSAIDKAQSNSALECCFGWFQMLMRIKAEEPCHHYLEGEEKENAMKPNMGTVDRLVRTVVAFVPIGLAVTGVIDSWGYGGMALLATAMFRYCPVYSLLHFRTCGSDALARYA